MRESGRASQPRISGRFLTSRITAAHIFLPLLLLCLAGCSADSSGGGAPETNPVTPAPNPSPTPTTPAWPRDGEFTDSQGRTMLYRLHARNEWDPNQPRGLVISLHGNNTGTQRDMLGGRSPDAALGLGLAFARVGSPEADR